MRSIFALFVWLWALPVLAANPVFVADGGYANMASSPGTLPIPNGSISNGQLMIMEVCAIDNSQTPTVSTPSGWTYYVNYSNTAGSGGYIDNCYVFWKIASSEGSTISVSFAGGAGLAGADGNIRVYSNTRATSPFNQSKYIGLASGTGASQTVTIPAFTETYVSGEVYLVVYISEHNLVVSSGTNYNPNTAHIYTNTGLANGFSFSDFSPGSQPGTMVISLGAGNSVININDEHAIGLTILPVSSGVEGLPLTGAGR